MLAYVRRCMVVRMVALADVHLLGNGFVDVWADDFAAWRWGRVVALGIYAENPAAVVEETKRRGKWAEPGSVPRQKPPMYVYACGSLERLRPWEYAVDGLFLDKDMKAVLARVQRCAEAEWAYLATRYYVEGGALELWRDRKGRPAAWAILHNNPTKAIKEAKKRGFWEEPATEP